MMMTAMILMMMVIIRIMKMKHPGSNVDGDQNVINYNEVPMRHPGSDTSATALNLG